MADFTLTDFMQESLHIEGILRPPFEHEMAGLEAFRRMIRPPTVMELTALCKTFQANAQLRDKLGLDVVVGNHFPPRGGQGIADNLKRLLDNSRDYTAFRLYCAFEALHPFTDGNGRTGRALWLWRMGGHPQSFLKSFHYQTLSFMDDL